MARVVIIGAGLTGLSAAYHLEKKGFSDYVVYEKENTLGGLCRSVTQDGFTFDYTGHLLHINDQYTRSLLETTIGFERFNTIDRRSYIYTHDIYVKYPFQINLKGLPLSVISECVTGYVNRKKSSRPAHTFREWVLTHFGKGIGKYFFFPYQEKIFAYSVDLLSASWTGRFVPSTSLEAIIQGIMGTYTEAVGYNASFFYPKVGGTESWVAAFGSSIAKPIFFQHTVVAVDMVNKEVIFSNGHVEFYDKLISTMPLDVLLGMLKEPTSVSLNTARHKLVCNSIINFNLGVARADLSDKHWIYFPEKKFLFYRLGFPHNFSSHLVPQNCSSLYGEFSYIKKSRAWIARCIERAIADVCRVLRIYPEEIITKKIIEISHAYVIYDAWRDSHIGGIHERLREYNIYSVGRYGEWKYSSMQDALLDGKKIAETIAILPARQVAVTESPAPRTGTYKETHADV